MKTQLKPTHGQRAKYLFNKKSEVSGALYWHKDCLFFLHNDFHFDGSRPSDCGGSMPGNYRFSWNLGRGEIDFDKLKLIKGKVKFLQFKEIKLNDEYTARVAPGMIYVGCQLIPAKAVRNLVKVLDSFKNGSSKR